MYAGPHSVDHVSAREVVGARDAGGPDGFEGTVHHTGAFVPELHPGEGVDGVVYTSVAGDEASEHPAVGGVDDCIAVKCGYVSFPQAYAVLEIQIFDAGDPLGSGDMGEESVLYREDVIRDGGGRPDVHPGPEEGTSSFRRFGDIGTDAESVGEVVYKGDFVRGRVVRLGIGLHLGRYWRRRLLWGTVSAE